MKIGGIIFCRRKQAAMNKYPIAHGTLPRPCRKCGEVKFITEMFAKGLAGICRDCWDEKVLEAKTKKEQEND